MRLGRRSLLALIPSALGAWGAARLGVRCIGSSEIWKLLQIVGDTDKARAIGNASMVAMRSPSVRRIVRALPSRPTAEMLRARIREEFAMGAVVVADGWVLSETEARLYALAALVHRE